MLLVVHTNLKPDDIQHLENLRELFGDSVSIEVAERLWDQVKDYAEYLKAKHEKEVKNERRGDK